MSDSIMFPNGRPQPPMPFGGQMQPPPQQPVPMFSPQGQGINQGPMPPPGGPPGGAPQGGGMEGAFVQQMMQGNGMQNKQADIMRKRKLADEMRGQNDSLLGGVTVGGQHAAPGLAQLAGNLYGTYAQAEKNTKLDQDQSDLTGQMGTNAKEMFDRWLAARGGK